MTTPRLIERFSTVFHPPSVEGAASSAVTTPWHILPRLFVPQSRRTGASQDDESSVHPWTT